MEDLVNDTLDILQSDLVDSSFPDWLSSQPPPPQVDNLPPYSLGSFVTDVSQQRLPNHNRDVVSSTPKLNFSHGDLINEDEDLDNTLVEFPPSPVLLSAARSRKRRRLPSAKKSSDELLNMSSLDKPNNNTQNESTNNTKEESRQSEATTVILENVISSPLNEKEQSTFDWSNLELSAHNETTSSSPSARIAASLGVKDAPVSWEPSLETPLTSKPHPEEVDTEGKLRWKHMNTLEKEALLPSGNVRPTSRQTLFQGGQLSFEDLDKTITPQVHAADCSATTSADNSPVLKPRKKSKLEQTEVVTKDQSCVAADEVDSWGSFNYEDIEAHESADKVQVESSFKSEIHLAPGLSSDDGSARLMPAKSQDSQGFLGDISLTTMEAMCQEAEKLAASKSKDHSPQLHISSSPAAKSSSSSVAATSSSSLPAATSLSPPATTSSSSPTATPSSSPPVCLTSTPVAKPASAKLFALPMESPVVVAEEVRRRKLLYKSDGFRDKCQSPLSDSGLGSGSNISGASKDLGKIKPEDSDFSSRVNSTVNSSKVLKTPITNIIKGCDMNLLFKKSENCSSLTLTKIETPECSSSKETPTTKPTSRSLGMARRGVPTNLLYSAQRKEKEVSSTPIPTVPTLSLADCREKLSDSEEEGEKENNHQSVKFEAAPVPNNHRPNNISNTNTTPLPKSDTKTKMGKGFFNPPRRSGTIVQTKEVNQGKLMKFTKPSEEKRSIMEKPLILNGKLDPSEELAVFNDKTDATNPPFCGFSTASGSKVNVSEKALREAQKLFESIQDAEEKFKSLENHGFLTAAGNKSKVSPEALQNAENKFSSTHDQFNDQMTSNELSTSSLDKVPMAGFSTAAGGKVNISAEALKKAQQMSETLNTNTSSLDNFSVTGFSTASGGKVKISAEALMKAQQMYESLDTNSFSLDNVPMTGFNTARGGKVNVSAEALKKAQKKFESVNQNTVTSGDNVPMTGFSTARGAKVNISAEALKKAQKKFESENENTTNTSSDNVPMVGFSTARGGKVNISAEALKRAQQNFESETENTVTSGDNVPMAGFSTARGGKVHISAEALKKAQKNFESGNGNTNTTSDNVQMAGFSTARGGKVNISAEALKRAQQNFESETENISTSLHNVQMAGFSTAKGRKVNISAEALKNSAKKFESESINNSSIAKVVALKKFENQSTPSPPLDQIPISGPSTAASAKVKISAEAFKNAQKRFETDSENVTNSSLDKVPMTGFGGFSTAAGGKVKISAEALKNAKEKFNDQDLTSFKESSEPSTSKFVSPLTSVGFSTAGGSNIKISAEAMKKAKNKFENGGAGDSLAGPKKISNEFEDDIDFDDDSDFDLINIAESSERQYLNQQRKPMTCHPYKRNDLQDKVMTCGPFMFDEAPETPKDVASAGFQAPYVPGKASHPAKRQLEEDFDVRCLFVKRIKMDEVETEKPNIEENGIIECRRLARKKQLALIESKKRKKVRLMMGVLLRAQMEKEDRIKLHQTCRQLAQNVVRPNVLAVNAQNARDFVFSGEDYFSSEAVKSNTNGVALGDGAVIILRDNGDVGCEEFESALLAMPGVDPQLIPSGWTRNHYGWIVWKLASVERRVALDDRVVEGVEGMALTPSSVMMQLKLRYDRELDRVERPIIRKITEKDEPPSTCMVLCVSGVAEGSLEVTDGWYSLPCQVDEGSQLHRLVRAGRLAVGTKIITAGAELEGGEQGCHPLEAGGKVKLVLHVNSTRRVKWWAKLGPAPPFTVRLDSLVAGGGPTPFLKLVVARTYPRMYYVKDQYGKASYMTEKNWNRMEKDNKSVEEVYQQVEKEMCGRSKGRRRVTKAMVKGVECGKELLELLESALDPDLDLTPSQREAVNEAREEKGRLIQEEVSRRMREKGAAATPLVKMRLVGEGGDGKSGLLTVWRPGEMGELFVEERILGVTGLTVSRVEGKVVHLTASRMTRYSELGKCCDERDLSRRIVPFHEMTEPDFNPLFNEVDTIGFVASLGDASKSSKGFQTVTLCDVNLRLVRLMVWGGLAAMGLKDVLTEGQVVACKDLEWRNTVIHQLPALYVREYSTITANPKGPTVMSQVNKFKGQIGKDFLASAKSAVLRGARNRPNTNTSASTVPSSVKSSTAFPSSSVASAWNVSENLIQSQRMRNQSKLAKLDAVAGAESSPCHQPSSQTSLPSYRPPRVSR